MEDIDTDLQTNEDNLWQDHFCRAAYASEAVVLLMSKEGFASTEIGKFFQPRSPLKLRLYRSQESTSPEDNRFLGAVLHKIALRGSPAPCSVKVEHYVLQKAQDAGLLVFDKFIDNGRIKFSCTPLIDNFDLMLKICCVPELLFEENEVDPQLHYYQSLSRDSEPTKRFFRKLMSILPDKRLALFIVPGRLFGEDSGKKISNLEEQMDFLIQIPNLKRDHILKIAIQLSDNQRLFEKEDGWIIKRFDKIKEQFWESEIRKLADLVSNALPESILKVAKQLREMPIEMRKALQELIMLPIAEAQLTQATAELIQRCQKIEMEIGNPQNLNLRVVVEAVRETTSALSLLYDIPNTVEPHLANETQDNDIDHCSFPPKSKSIYASIFPQPQSSDQSQTQSDVVNKPISRNNPNTLTRECLKFLLNNIFRYQDFLEDQAELVEKILSLQGSIGLLKPGGGKNIAFQLASFLQPGIALLVVPTRFMAMDLKYSLSANGLNKNVAIFGSDDEKEQNNYDSMKWHLLDIIILAADSLNDQGNRDRLDDIFSNPANFLAFNEAHVISEWSQGFKLGYLNSVRLVKDYSNRRSKPCLIALTSNNSKFVLLDIMHEFDLVDLDCIVESTYYSRANLHYEMHKVNEKNRMQILISNLRAILRNCEKEGNNTTIPSGLIISTHEEDEDMGLANLSKSFRQYLDVPVGVCSLNPPKKFLRLGGNTEKWTKSSLKALLQFKRRELSVLLCSSDIANELSKEDIRFTIHTAIPSSIEEFYLQSGRAGYDGRQSTCMAFVSENTEPSSKIETFSTWSEEIKNKKLLIWEFPGKIMEKRIQCLVISKLLGSIKGHNMGDKVDCEIYISSFPERLFLINGELKAPLKRKEWLIEKALHRLLLIGFIESYEKRSGVFKVKAIISTGHQIYNNYIKYINRYEIESLANPYHPKKKIAAYKNAVLECGCRLVNYSYQRIKGKKEDDIEKMIRAAEIGFESSEKIYDFLNEYMDSTEITARLDAMTSESFGGVFGDIKGRDDLLGIFFACQRKLLQKPDDPMLRIISGFCAQAFPETLRKQKDIVKGFCSLVNSTSAANRANLALQIVSYAELILPSRRDSTLELIWQVDQSRDMSRLCYEKSELSSNLYYLSLFKLVNGILGASKVEVSGNE